MRGSSQETAEWLLSLLGWRFSRKDEKRLPFSPSFSVLGVVFDLTGSQSGHVVVSNKPDRLAAIEQQVADIIAEGSCKPAFAASLRGRFQYAEGQVFGRAVAVSMPCFRRRAMSSDQVSHLSEEIESELLWVIDYLSAAVPRTLHAKETRPPMLVFTDASLEGNDTAAAVGGVMYDGASCEFFSSALRADQLSLLQTECMHVIAVLEVLSVACAVRIWSANALRRREFHLIDNDSARACLIKMSSGSAAINNVLRRVTIMSAASPSFA